VGYVQDKVRPGTGREGALGYERYIAGEHMDVRRDCVSFARRIFFSWDQTVRNELRTLRGWVEIKSSWPLSVRNF